MFTARRWHVFFWFVVALIVGATVHAAGVAAERLPVQGKTVSVNEMEMYYEIHGEGKPLVLLHGFGRSGAVWSPFVADFSEHYQLIIPDLRGHGRSTNPSKSFTHRQSALDVFALLDALQIDQCRAVGISTGGMTLLHMATSQAKRVESMALVGATHFFPVDSREIMASVQFDKLTDEELLLLRSLHRHGDEQIRLLVEQFHAFKDSYQDVNFTPPYLSTVTAKTLILHGDRDKLFPVSIAMEMYQSIPDSYLWIVPNGGHVPLEEDWKPDDTKRLLQFLKDDWEGKNAPR